MSTRRSIPVIDPALAIDELAQRVRQLSPAARALLIERVTAELKQDMDATRPSRSLLGLWAGYGSAPSFADVEDARRESWGAFPRDLA
jgi:hypothetical protein